MVDQLASVQHTLDLIDVIGLSLEGETVADLVHVPALHLQAERIRFDQGEHLVFRFGQIIPGILSDGIGVFG